MNIKIKHRFNGSVLFSIEAGSLRLAVKAAVEADADLGSADLGYADLGSSDLRSANLRSANLGYANLRSADLRYADLRSADLGSADLGSADLRYANLRYADLRSADLRYADFRSADLGSADLRYVDLGSADLRSADLGSADLGYADLRSANLRSADLGYADLRYADLRYANLRSADLRSADLGYADLGYADLGSADLRYAKGLNPARCTPLLMLLDQPGKIRAYKLVDKNNVGPFNGGIEYEVGKIYKVNDADTDVTTHCGAGINLATLDWCTANWSKGYKILIAEFTAKDIAAIPTATDGKWRCHKIKIVGEKDLVKIGLVEKEVKQ